MAIIGKPFQDRFANKGKPKLTTHVVARTKLLRKFTFEQFNATHIVMNIPWPAPSGKCKINKNDGIALAHWLLDICSSKDK